MTGRLLRRTPPPAVVSGRVVGGGEYVLPRGEAVTTALASTGNLWVTHFTAAKTELIQTVQTGTGGSGTVAVSATHAWVMFLDWDGTQYTPNAVSVDDPTRWTGEFQTYNTQLYRWDHAGQAGYEGFQKVAGRKYAFGVLWIGAGQAPSLPGGSGWYQDSMVEPRTNAWIGSQTVPPTAAYQGVWFAPDSRRFQGYLRR
jgi:hypothetical protein